MAGGDREHEYGIHLSKTEGSQLGLDTYEDYTIVAVKSGLVQTWNAEHPDKTVKVGDRIVEVNGIRDNLAQMQSECQQNKTLQLKLHRAPANRDAEKTQVSDVSGQWSSSAPLSGSSHPPPVQTLGQSLREWEIVSKADAASSKMKDIPRQVRDCVVNASQGARPFLEKVDQLVTRTTQWQQMYAKETSETVKVGIATALVFAGGQFPLTFVCFQSFDLACREKVQNAWQELRDNYTSTASQNNLQLVRLKDLGDLLGAIVLAKTPEDKEAAKRRLLAIVKCIDPEKLRKLARDLWPGLLAVLVTLRSRFVLAVGLGATVGQMMCETLQLIVRQRWERLCLINRRWCDVALQQSCSLFSVCCAFYFPGFMNSLNSALKGSSTLAKALFDYAKSQRNLAEDQRSTVGKCVLPLLVQASPGLDKEEEVAKWSIAALGIYYQVTRRSPLGLIAKVSLTPLLLLEYFLNRVAQTRRF